MVSCYQQVYRHHGDYNKLQQYTSVFEITGQKCGKAKMSIISQICWCSVTWYQYVEHLCKHLMDYYIHDILNIVLTAWVQQLWWFIKWTSSVLWEVVTEYTS
jgi:hypothetical protein